MYLLTSLLGTALLALVFFGLAILVLRQKSSLIFDIYPRKGVFYHLKYVIALLIVKRLRQKFYHRNEARFSTPAFMERADRPQELSKHPQSYDVISFMAANAAGQKLLVTLERRRRGLLKACIYIWLAEQGLLCSPNLPDMLHFTTNGEQDNPEFRGSGFHVYPEVEMRYWHISYEGELRQVASGALLPVKLQLKFSSSAAYFNYSRDLSGAVIADSIAREPWDDAFYNMLRNVDQILERRLHYEQNGVLEGELQLGGAVLPLQLKGFRDHSYGTERCLVIINRYVFLALFLDDGTNMVIGNLSQPSTFLSSLKVGYVCTPAGVYQPITDSNFELYSYGHKGSPSKHQNFIVQTAAQKYLVQVQVQECAERFVGADWESKVYNQFLSCKVNGVQGHGISEYLYRHSGGRPAEVSDKDPEWYQRLRSFEERLSSGETVEDSEEFFF